MNPRTGLAVGVLLAVVFAACSGAGPSTNGVAQLDSPGPASSGDPSASAGAGASLSPDDVYQAMLAYSRCMRAHGMTNFPDPVNDNGQIGLRVSGGPGKDLDPNSATFQTAQEACQSLMPAKETRNGGVVSDQQRQQALQFSQCMRDHGVTDFPDPQFTGGGVTIGGNGEGAGLDPNSPTSQAAQQACQSLMLGRAQGGGRTQDTGAPTAGNQP